MDSVFAKGSSMYSISCRQSFCCLITKNCIEESAYRIFPRVCYISGDSTLLTLSAQRHLHMLVPISKKATFVIPYRTSFFDQRRQSYLQPMCMLQYLHFFRCSKTNGMKNTIRQKQPTAAYSVFQDFYTHLQYT